MKKTLFRAFAILFISSLAMCTKKETPIIAKVWNISLDYSSVNNPNGVWTYGRKWSAATTAFDLMTVPWGSSGWYFGNVGHGGPSIQAGPLLWAKNNSNGLPCVRWTCPETSIYSLTASFTGADSRGVDVVVYITKNGVVLFTDTIQVNNGVVNFTLDKFKLSGNDTIDFVIKWNGGVYYETSWTKVSALISK